jgi:hypothetical protein
LIIRGNYIIKQLDQTLREEELKDLARDEIARQLVLATIGELSDNLIREESSPKYEYGRFIIDVDINALEG